MAPPAPLPVALDPLIWKACAGNSVQIPTVDSMVYYFPKGHAEQASSEPDKDYNMKSFVRWISGVHFLAKHDTDEVYTKTILVSAGDSPPASLVSSSLGDDGGSVVSYVKILTPSDANNGGGFTVPKVCADSIFPALNFRDDPPLQKLFIRDVHGKMWSFRHIYRGKPCRHLLTTGWSGFVNSKKLVARDSVVFIKNRSTGELFVGVRRRPVGRSCGSSDDDFSKVKPEESSSSGDGDVEGFSKDNRRGGSRVPPDTVVEEAVGLAENGRPFEVLYYPTVGSPNFLVKADAVDAAKRLAWWVGTRVRKAVCSSEDSSRTTWYHGTVSHVAYEPQAYARFPSLLWRMLTVKWDSVLQNWETVSPWEVELVSDFPLIGTSLIHSHGTITACTKKPRVRQNRESPAADGADQNPFGLDTFPVGIQGARHDPSCCASSSLSYYLAPAGIGSTSRSTSSSPPIQTGFHNNNGEELSGNSARDTPTAPEAIGGSFRLFGKTMHPG